jgi:hypothetical protein
MTLPTEHLLANKSNTPAWEICLAPVQVLKLMKCGRANQFDPATDKIYKTAEQKAYRPIGQ